MVIYVVQRGDTIGSIADKFGVTVFRLVQDNGLANPNQLVEGQALVITYPYKTHLVEEGDTLSGIAQRYNISLMQLYRNNPFLSDRDYIMPGEELVISYNTKGKTVVAGYAYPFINSGTLAKTLPYLTYLFIVNYKIIDEGNLLSSYDATDIINQALSYAAIPIMGVTAVSPSGEMDVEAVFNLLINQSYQERFIDNIINRLRTSGYYGVNFFVSALSESNQTLYFELLRKLSNRIRSEGYLLFTTVNPGFAFSNSDVSFRRIDYSDVRNMVDGVIFIRELRAGFQGPPRPITSVSISDELFDYLIPTIPSESIYIEIPLLSYDWELPYSSDTSIRCMALSSAVSLAYDVGAVIRFDENSMTPFFMYRNTYPLNQKDHIVWFIDARTINTMLHLAAGKCMAGASIWNIMIYFQQMWSVLVSQYDVIKYLPE